MVKIEAKTSPLDMSDVDISPKMFVTKGIEGRFGFGQYFLEDVEHKLVPKEPSVCLRRAPGPLGESRAASRTVLIYLSCCHGYGSNIMGDFKCRIYS